MGCHTSKEWAPDTAAKPGQSSQWTHVAWSGGAARGIVCVGAYRALWEYGVISESQGAAGTSVGGLFAVATVLQVQPPTLERDIMALDTTRFADGSACGLLCGRLGLHRGRYLERWCEKFVTRHSGRARCTFAQLHARTGRTLRICVWNETLARTEFWDHETCPDMPISHALRASASMPGYFDPVTQDGHMFVDGGVGNILPTDAFANTTTLGVMLLGAQESATAALATEQHVRSLVDHFESVYEGFAATQFRLQHGPAWTARCISMQCPDKPQWDISFTKLEKGEWFRKSYQNARAEIFRLKKIVDGV